MEIGVELCKRYLPEWATFLEGKFQLKIGSVTIVGAKPLQVDEFIFVKHDGNLVAVRKSDRKINMAHVCNAGGLSSQDISQWKMKHGFTAEVLRGNNMIKGSYADYSTAMELCRSLGLSRIENILFQVESTFTQNHQGNIAPENVSSLLKGRATTTRVASRLSHNLDIELEPSGELHNITKTAAEGNKSRRETSAREIQSRNRFSIAGSLLTSSREQSADDLEEKAKETQGQNMGEIPPLPHLSQNSIGDIRQFQTNRDSGGQMNPDAWEVLYAGDVSQQSHLSQIKPTFGGDAQSFNYAQYLDELM